MRGFVAIDLPEPVLDTLESLQDDLAVGRPMARETLHLTLAFLGERDDAALAAVHEERTGLAAGTFELTRRGGGMSGGRRPRVLWAGVGHQPALGALRDRVRRAVRRAGIELPRERFRPHVTIARFGPHPHRDELRKIEEFLERNGSFRADPFAVGQVTLFRSVLHRNGAVHEPLAVYGLKGP